MNIARLMEAARDIALKSQQKVDEVVWGGITTHSFPPVEVARRIVVLRQ